MYYGVGESGLTGSAHPLWTDDALDRPTVAHIQ